MTKRLSIAVALVALVCGGLVLFNVLRDRRIHEFFANRLPDVVTVSASRIEATIWHPGIEAVGTVNAVRGVDVAAETPGVVRRVAFESNQHVQRGQLLVQLNDEVVRAEIPGANAAFNAARLELNRVRRLWEKGVAAQAAYDDAVSKAAAAQSELERLRAVVNQKSIEAPFAGVIGIPRVEVGEYVQTGDTIATLQNLDRFRVDFTVPEQRAGDLSIGQEVRVGTQAGEFRHQGSITGIDPKADDATRLVAVRCELRNAERALRPGQFVQVRVLLPPEPGIISLAQTAVITSLYGEHVFKLVRLDQPPSALRPGKRAVFRAEQVFVRTGRRSGGRVEVISGLEPGFLIVTSGQNKLQSGSLARIDNTIDPDKLARTVQQQ